MQKIPSSVVRNVVLGTRTKGSIKAQSATMMEHPHCSAQISPERHCGIACRADQLRSAVQAGTWRSLGARTTCTTTG